MSATPVVKRGVRVLRRILREQNFDLRHLDPAGFRDWMARQVAFWEGDAVFARRVRIRNLRRAHPELLDLERAHRAAADVDAATSQFGRLTAIEQELSDAEKAIAGLTAALLGASSDKKANLRNKLDAFLLKQAGLTREQTALIRTSAPRQRLLVLRTELAELRSRLGLDREEAQLAKLMKRQGRHSDRIGTSFEQQALAITQRFILPDLARGDSWSELRILSGVKLGAAPIELDQVIVRPARRKGAPVTALAVIEVKRNINDLAHGFRQRQENLAWLTGDGEGYDPARYRTLHFKSGHFDRVAVHEQDGLACSFTRDSFRFFHREPANGFFLGRLYFITRAGPLWGLSAAGLSRVRRRVSTDDRFDLANDAYLSRLLDWCRSQAESTETPDVLQRVAADPRWARHILIVAR